MQQIQSLYLQFLSNFPANLQPFISMGLVALIIYAVIQVIKKDFIYIIVLVVLLPGSVPILENVWQGILDLIHFLLKTK